MDNLSRQHVKIFVAYYLTLAALFVGSYFPESRLWGFSHWAYMPDLWRYLAFAIALVAPVAVHLLITRRAIEDISPEDDKSGRFFVIATVVTTIISAACFYLFRARTHFLGDGYTVLASLASDNYLIKTREIGEALIHLWIRDLIGSGESAALASFQFISIVSGIIFVVVVTLSSKAFFKSNYQRLLYVLGTVTSGYMLLYFGYVEYYSGFVLPVMIVTLTGLLISRGRVSRWWILPALVFAVFMHIMGVTLIPGVVYILLSDTKVAEHFTELSLRARNFIIAFVLLACAAVFIYFYQNVYFFRFSLLHIFSDRFTIDGYTLFSFDHLLDFVNLSVLLIPSLLLFLFVIVNVDLKKLLKEKDHRFLLLLALGAFGAAFIFDPKLGMPRDWDLFSFAGVPIVLLSVFLILRSALSSKIKILILTLSVILNLFALVPRVHIQMNPATSIGRLIDYMKLDKTKNRSTCTILINYCRDNGLPGRARQAERLLVNNYPEHDLIRKANDLKSNREYAEAIQCYEKVIGMNPIWIDAYVHLADLYLQREQADTALKLLEIANGLNPYNHVIMLFKGSAHYMKGEIEDAEKAWLKSISYNRKYLSPVVNLVGLYRQTGDQQRMIEYMEMASQLEGCPYYILADLGVFYVQDGDYERGSVFIKKAIEEGLDDQYVENLLNAYPQLNAYLAP